MVIMASAIRMPQKQKALFTTAVWGDQFIERFLNYSLRTQLSAGNLGAFDQESLFLLISDEKSIKRIKRSQIYQHLKRHVEVETIDISSIVHESPGKYSLLTECQNYALQRAAPFNTIFFGYGDALWADGSYRAAAARLLQGYDAVFSFGYPVLEQPVKAILRCMAHEDSASAITIPPRTFAQYIYRHLHPMAHANRWSSQWMTHCPSYLVWNVPEQGLLLRAFHMHPVALKVRANSPSFMTPFQSTLDEEFVARLYRTNPRIYVATDSDEIGVCSLAEETDLPYRMEPPRPVNIGDLTKFAERYAGLSHRELFKHSIRLKIEDPIESRWQTAELEAAAIEKEVSQRLAIPDSVLALEHPEAFAARADRQIKYLHWFKKVSPRANISNSTKPSKAEPQANSNVLSMSAGHFIVSHSIASHDGTQEIARRFLLSVRASTIHQTRAKHTLMGRLRTVPRRIVVGVVKLLHALGITKMVRLWILALLPKSMQQRAHNWVYNLGQRISVGPPPRIAVHSNPRPWFRLFRWIRQTLGRNVHEK